MAEPHVRRFHILAALLSPWVTVPLAVVLAAVLFLPLSWPPGRGAFRSSSPAVKVAILRDRRGDSDPALLIEALADPDADVRLMAAMQSWSPPRLSESVIKALIGALKDDHVGVRREAAEPLLHASSASTELLMLALADEHPRVRAGAAFALGEASIKGDGGRTPAEIVRTIPLLKVALQDADEEVRHNASRALRDLRRSNPTLVNEKDLKP